MKTHRFFSSRKLVALVSATMLLGFSLAYGVSGVGDETSHTRSAQAAPSQPGLPNAPAYTGGWQLIGDLQSVWSDYGSADSSGHYLPADAIYWGDTYGVGAQGYMNGNPANTIGATVTMQGASVNFATDNSSFTTKPIMGFRRTALAGSADNRTTPAIATGIATSPSGASGFCSGGFQATACVESTFSSEAVGVFGGKANPVDPDTGQTYASEGNTAAAKNPPLTIYWWSWNGNNTTTQQRYLNCPTGTDPFVRTTDGSPNIYMTCKPIPGGWDINTTGGVTGGNGNTTGQYVTGTGNNGCVIFPTKPMSCRYGIYYSDTGGEVDQTSGYVYSESATGSDVDLQNVTSQRWNNAGVQYLIWDPVTARYAIGGTIQPADWASTLNWTDGSYSGGCTYQGYVAVGSSCTPTANPQYAPQMSKARMSVLALSPADQVSAGNSQCVGAAYPYGTNGKGAGCGYLGNGTGTAGNGGPIAGADYRTTPDFGLDALGNMFLYAGGGPFGSAGGSWANGTWNSNQKNLQLYKITPALSADGSMFLNGSPTSPWTYQMVTPITPAAGQVWSQGYFDVGVGIMNGKFLLGGYTSTAKNGTYFPPNTYNTTNAATGSASAMVNIDPLSGQAQIVSSGTNNLTDTIGQNGLSGTVYPGTAGCTGGVCAVFDNGSPQELQVVSGYVYDDNGTKGSGFTPGQFDGLANETMAIYQVGGTASAPTYTLVGTQQTNSQDQYNFIVSGNGTYVVRLVQPQISQANVNSSAPYYSTAPTAPVNAYQTWGGVLSGAANDGASVSAMACVNATGSGSFNNGHYFGNISGDAPGATPITGACQGANASPYIDATVGAIGSQVTSTQNFGTFGQVTFGSYQVAPQMNFAVSIAGSHGDADNSAAGTGHANFYNTLFGQNGPYYGSPQGVLELGANLGSYPDGVNDPNANDSTQVGSNGLTRAPANGKAGTDDGVKVLIPNDPSKISSGQTPAQYCSNASNPCTVMPLQNTVLVAGQTYATQTTVQGNTPSLPSAGVLGWMSFATNKGLTCPPGPPLLPSANPLTTTYLGTNTVCGTAAFIAGSGTITTPSGSSMSTSVVTGTITAPAQNVSSPGSYPIQSRYATSLNGTTGSVAWGSVPALPTSSTWAWSAYDNSTGLYTPPAQGSAAANTSAWITPGEVEDYQFTDAFALVRIAATVDGTPASAQQLGNLQYQLTNISTSAVSGSTPSDSIDFTQSAINGQVPGTILSPAVHIPMQLSSAANGTQYVSITNLTSTGAPSYPNPANGDYSLSDVACVNGAGTSYVYDASNANTLDGIKVQLPTQPADITCTFTYSSVSNSGTLPAAGGLPIRHILGFALLGFGGIGATALWTRRRRLF